MNPSTLRPFPISVVAMGPGSQGEEAPDYLPMPKGMDTFHQPRLPDNASPMVRTQCGQMDRILVTLLFSKFSRFCSAN